jgi:hypothetical protein
MAQKVGGIAHVKINGITYPLRGNAKHKPGRKSREEVIGADGFHGYKEMAEAPSIEMDITDRGNMDVAMLNDLEDATITLEYNNGKVFVLKGAAQMNHLEVDDIEGQFTVRFVGSEGKEILNNG